MHHMIWSYSNQHVKFNIVHLEEGLDGQIFVVGFSNFVSMLIMKHD
jgi:hypothetical protein